MVGYWYISYTIYLFHSFLLQRSATDDNDDKTKCIDVGYLTGLD